MSRVGDASTRPAPQPTPTTRPTPTARPAPTPQPTPTARPTPPAPQQTGHSSASEFLQSAFTVANNVANGIQVPSGLAGLNPTTAPGLSLGLNRLNGVGSLAAIPLSGITAAQHISAAVANPNQSTIAQATGSTINVPRNIAAGAGALFGAANARTYRDAFRAAEGAFRTAAPAASQRALSAASHAAARSSLDAVTSGIRSGATQLVNSNGVRAAESAISSAVRSSSDDAIRTIMGTGTRAAARAELRTAAAGAARAATSAAAHSGASALGRAAARFAPGVNVAVAAMDVGIFAATMANPESSTTARVTSGITALGSIAAATNIPVLSQAGAAVSVVSSFVGGLFG
ncbi:hypothetical protein [Hyalangium gracile]|uniref:hypothetical protein n=1 Tax=Hyalangium gracile TaxID=394092 RepID=UPI001CCCBFE3|nr:hypothetical protein [Hyalangium gracile]